MEIYSLGHPRQRPQEEVNVTNLHTESSAVASGHPWQSYYRLALIVRTHDYARLEL